MKTKLFILSLLLQVTLIASGQSRAPQKLSSNLNLYSGDLLNFYNDVVVNKSLENNETVNYEGSPYLNTEFQNGVLITKDSIMYNGLKLRYNAYNDNFEYERNDIAFEIDNSADILLIQLGNKIFVKQNYIEKNKKSSGFFQLLLEGKIPLYAKHKVIFQKEQPPKPYRETKPASFEKSSSDYYIQKPKSDRLFKITSKKQFLRLLPDHSSSVATFIKENNLKIKNEENLYQIVKYYNEL